ncbi:hypothetical protein BDN70DRAFT_398913 [Pholiota conissans]|uniref:Uncharacterized protein n=1 Tax=Pholiota conissans TaxID=109636 RepID=A0A9P5YPX4_9AGAR|nr:hypothetical protein BDN70DRAFT_398913 [Pholiota conissans]
MHCSAPLANFAVSAVLSQLIFNNPNAGVIPSHITLSSRDNHLQHQHNAQSLSGPLIKSGIIGSADAASALASALLIPTSALAIANTHVASVASAQSPISLHHSLLRTQNQYLASRSPRLTSLPRMDPGLYVQPYWEGWVRTLRKAFKTEAPRIADAPGPGGRGRFEYPEYSGGMGGGGGVGLIGWETAFGAIEGGGHGREKARVRVGDGRGSGREDRWDGYGYHGTERSRRDREEIHYEWRERWAVIKEGYIYLFRNREVRL